MIWQTQYLITERDRLFLYYGGTEGPHRQISDTRAPSVAINGQEAVIDHGGHFLPFNAALCRSSWRLDRLYALASNAGGPTVGVATTVPRDLGCHRLFVDVATRPAKRASTPGLDAGVLEAEVLDRGGRPIAGFTRRDCTPLTGDHRRVGVSWRGGPTLPAGARQVRFYLKRAFLYGFQV